MGVGLPQQEPVFARQPYPGCVCLDGPLKHHWKTLCKARNKPALPSSSNQEENTRRIALTNAHRTARLILIEALEAKPPKTSRARSASSSSVTQYAPALAPETAPFVQQDSGSPLAVAARRSHVYEYIGSDQPISPRMSPRPMTSPSAFRKRPVPPALRQPVRSRPSTAAPV